MRLPQIWTCFNALLSALLLILTLTSSRMPADIGFRADERAGRTYITWVMPASVAWDAGIRSGDLLPAGPPAASVESIEVLHDQGRAQLFDPERLRLPRSSESVMLVLGLLVLLVTGSALTRSGYHTKTLTLMAPFAVVGMGLLVAPATAASRGWALVLMFGCILTLGPSFLHACLYFTRPLEGCQGGWLAYRMFVYVLGLAALLVYVGAVIAGGTAYLVARFLEDACLAACIVGGLLVLLKSSPHLQTKPDRVAPIIVLLIMSAGLVPCAVLIIGPHLTTITLATPLLVVASLFVFPVAYAYGVQRHRLLGLPSIWGRRLTRAVGMAILAALYLVLLNALPHWIIRIVDGGTRPLTLAAFVLGLSALPLARSGARVADRLIFRDVYSHHRAVRHLVNVVRTAADVRTSMVDALRDVRGWMDLTWLAVLVRVSEGWAVRALDSDLQADAQANLAAALATQWPLEPITPGMRPAVSATIPLVCGTEMEAVLLAGPKANGEQIRRGDRDILTVLATMLGTQLTRAQLLLEAQDRVAELECHKDELRRLGHRLRAAQEDERKWVSAEIHDGPLQLLHALLQNFDRAASSQSCRDLAAQAVVDLRAICVELRPPALDDLELPALLASLARRMESRTGCPITVASKAYVPDHLDRDVQVSLYRIAQEALANCARHAKASTITVLLRVDECHISLDVCDDGQGFDGAMMEQLGGRAGNGERLGLLEMREHARIFGGTVSVYSGHGEGAQVRTVIPLTFPEGAER